ncbi:hypothetical protein JXL19_08195, partial [bacterium]|nr:hypothetical protein [bacterium]
DNHYFPFPRKADTEEYIEDIGGGRYRAYLRKTGNGETIEHFAVPGRLYRYLFFWPAIQRYFISLDDKCHKEYAQNLIPRAAGYSTGLLNYFFRGEMDMVRNNETDSHYVIVNNTEEDMDGTFELYYDNLNDERIKFWSKAFILGGISSGNNKSGYIDFTEPGDAKEPGKYMLVFNGRLGNETVAVVGKVINPCEFYINITCNGLMPAKPKTVKLVDADGKEYVKTSSEAEPNKFGPFSDIKFPAIFYLYYKDKPILPNETMFTFWTQCEANDPDVRHTKANEFPCPLFGNYVQFDIPAGPGDFNVKEVKWKKGPIISALPDQTMVFDFSDLKVLEKVKVHYKTWYPPMEYGCDPLPETIVVNQKSYPSVLLGRYPNDCSINSFAEECKTGDCQPAPDSPPNPYGTCLWTDYTEKIGAYNVTKETMLILTDKDGNGPVFSDKDIYVDARVIVLGIGCCDGGGGADAYYEENFDIQAWEWYTFKMVNVPVDRI